MSASWLSYYQIIKFMKKQNIIPKSVYISPRMEVMEIATENVIAGSPVLLMLTMEGQTLRDPITVTSSEYDSIFE